MSSRCITTCSLRVAVFVACCLFLCAACGRCGFGSYYTHGINQYSGDGTISDTSQSSGLFGTRGYVVEFPKFDLGEKYEKRFRLMRLPKLGSAEAEIRLIVNDPTVEKHKETLTGKIAIKLSDSSGREIAGYNKKISDLIWSSPIHDHTGHALYDVDHSDFVPRSDETYTLTVSYEPDPTLISHTAYIYVWCGCGGS
jgi:hypothetical protein